MSEEKYKTFSKNCIGDTLLVIFEEQRQGDLLYGYTENYIRVSAPYNEDLVGKISDFILTQESLVL